MVRIRLRRTGKKKQPSYRVVVADRESPRDGRFIEIIGHYNPRTEPVTIEIQADRAVYWLLQGAQPSDAVSRLLRKEGILDRFEAAKRGEPVPETALEDREEVPVTEAEVETEIEAEEEQDAEAGIEAEDEIESLEEPAAETE
jgi:small subunit ribosomal protein S16